MNQSGRRVWLLPRRSYGRPRLTRSVVARAGCAALTFGLVLAPLTLAAAATPDATAPASLAAANVSAPAAAAAAVEGSDGQLWAQTPPRGSGWQPLGGVIVAPPAVAAAAGAPADPLFVATGTTKALYMRSVTVGWHAIPVARCVGGPAAVITSSASGSMLTVACRGTDNALWYKTTTMPASGLPVFTGGWTRLGGVLTAGPAVAPVGTTMTFFVRGTNGHIYLRTPTTGFSQTSWVCIGSPAAAQPPGGRVTTFACQGTNRALWEATNSGSGWSKTVSLGGTLVGNPAVVAGSQETDFLADGTDHAVWQRTPAGWTSLGQLIYPDGAPAGGPVGGPGAVALNIPAGTPWGNPIEIRGSAALGPGTFYGSVASLSCPSAGNCTGAGSYTLGPCNSPCTYEPQAMAVSELNGTWDNAIEVPGTAALNTGKAAGVTSVSCPSAGNCALGGGYADRHDNDNAFVASEVNGTWANAIEVPGMASLSIGASSPFAYVYSVSCGSAGNCAAGGGYTDSSGHGQAFVADEVNGAWGNAIEVPGTAVLNTGGSAGLQSMSCASAGNCAAVGTYTDSVGHSQVFVADEVNGSWDNAIEVPGTAALNTGSMSALVAQTDSVSCGSTGNCAIGGDYIDSSGHTQAFVANEVNGSWETAIEVPGTAALNTGNAYVFSVSCPSAGNCSAGGEYSLTFPSSGDPSSEPFVVSEVNGTWREAIEVPGTALSAGGHLVVSVACGSPGNCAAGGYYEDNSRYYHAFVLSEVNGTWGEAIQVPGTAIGEYVSSVSCPAAGSCTAGGFGASGAFVLSQN